MSSRPRRGRWRRAPRRNSSRRSRRARWRRTNDDLNSSWTARSHLENHSTARRCSNDPSRWNPCWWLAPGARATSSSTRTSSISPARSSPGDTTIARFDSPTGATPRARSLGAGRTIFFRARRDRRGGRSRCWCTRRPGRSRRGSRRRAWWNSSPTTRRGAIERSSASANTDRNSSCASPQRWRARRWCSRNRPWISVCFSAASRETRTSSSETRPRCPPRGPSRKKDTPRTRRRGARLSSPRRGGCCHHTRRWRWSAR